ncbi:MAG: YwmB family TATA-box binding protein [Bacillus sp. (in: Bacteria)]|nr:YwmB family TATA-box binding protein [Bacillus sp. (in: firmicutes)]
MGKNWQFILILAGLLLSFTLLFEENKTRSEDNVQLPQHTLQIIEEELNPLDIRLNNYNLYGRNHQDKIPSYDEVMEYLEFWKQTNDRVEWTFQETEEREAWIGTYTDPTETYTERLAIYVNQQGDFYSAYTIYEVSFLPVKDWKNLFSELFADTSTISLLYAEDVFVRVEGTVEGNEADNVKQWGNTIVNALSGKVVEGISEETFVSLSAHTNLWGQEINSNGQQMNLQVALRNISHGLGEETTVTIGTPLITTEY